jgi:hypothetical protein
MLVGVATAQTEPPQPPPGQTPPPLPDPTKPSQRMQDKLGARPPEGAAPSASRIPTILLKGRVIARGRAAALVDVNGRTHTVTQGTTLIVSGTQVLTFVEVSAAEVRVEVNVPKETLVLN